MENYNTKEFIKSYYDKFLEIINNAKARIATLPEYNSQVALIKEAFTNTLSDQLAYTESMMREALEGAVWDHLVVAFFGETNAGKSTLVETFRILFDENRRQRLEDNPDLKEDGIIVGDGSPDFTKTYEEYNLNIAKRPFILIDVPGIEGKESDFRDEIKRALKQAHLVLYVQGKNKKPDKATADKIKKYLSDWVNVYSVFNVRGAISNYDEEEERIDLISGDVPKNETLIQNTFRDILGDVYKGNITTQAHIALCSVARFSEERQRLIDYQKKLVIYFGGTEKAFDFSRFKELSKLIEKKSSCFSDEICVANKQKLMALGGQMYKNILMTLSDNKEKITKLENALGSYSCSISAEMKSFSRTLKTKVICKVNSLYSNLFDELCDIIDECGNNNEIKNRFQEVTFRYDSLLDESINDLLRDELVYFNNKLKQKQKELIDCYKKDWKEVSLSTISFEMIDMSMALKDMSFNISDEIFSSAATIVTGAALGFAIGNVPGALIGAAISEGIRRIRSSFFDDGRSQAKMKVKALLDEQKHILVSDLGNELNTQISHVKRTIEATCAKLEADRKGLSDLSAIIDEINYNIDVQVKSI